MRQNLTRKNYPVYPGPRMWSRSRCKPSLRQGGTKQERKRGLVQYQGVYSSHFPWTLIWFGFSFFFQVQFDHDRVELLCLLYRVSHKQIVPVWFAVGVSKVIRGHERSTRNITLVCNELGTLCSVIKVCPHRVIFFSSRRIRLIHRCRCFHVGSRLS